MLVNDLKIEDLQNDKLTPDGFKIVIPVVSFQEN